MGVDEYYGYTFTARDETPEEYRARAEPSEPLPRGIDEVGLLDHDDLAAELGLSDGESLGGFGDLSADLSDLEQIGSVDSSFGFADEFEDLDIPVDTGGDLK